MSYCVQCGKKLEDDSIICPDCRSENESTEKLNEIKEKPNELKQSEKKKIKLNSKGNPKYIWITFPSAIVFFIGGFCVLVYLAIDAIFIQPDKNSNIGIVPYIFLIIFGIISVLIAKEIYRLKKSANIQNKQNSLKKIHSIGKYASGFLAIMIFGGGLLFGILNIAKAQNISLVNLAWKVGTVSAVIAFIWGLIKPKKKSE